MFKLILILIVISAFLHWYGFDQWLEVDSKKKTHKDKSIYKEYYTEMVVRNNNLSDDDNY